MSSLDNVKLLIEEMNVLGEKHDYLFFDLAAEIVEKLFVVYLDINGRSFGEFLEKNKVREFLNDLQLPISDLDIINNYAKKVRHSIEFMVSYTVAHNAVTDVINSFFRQLEVNGMASYFGRLKKIDNDLYGNENHLLFKDKVTTLRTYQMSNYIKRENEDRGLYYLAVFYERLLKLFLYKSKYKDRVIKETFSQILDNKKYIEYLRTYFDEFHVTNELFLDLKRLNKVRSTVRHTFLKPDTSNLNIALLDNFAKVFGNDLLEDFKKDFQRNIHLSSDLIKIINHYRTDFLYWDYAIKEEFIDRLNNTEDEDIVLDTLLKELGKDDYLIYKVCDKLNRKVEKLNV